MAEKLGLYVHIPFCRSKCDYCDFYSLAGKEGRMDDYQKALLAHMKETAPLTRGWQVDTVYFGGGTPSFYGEKRLREVLKTVAKRFDLAKDAEITVECNPDSVDKKVFQALRRAGVNRISLGVQSAHDCELNCLHRPHTFQQAQRAVAAAREAKIKNISLDLIYGLPNQDMAGWRDTVEQVLELEPEHLSCYGLKVEPGTPLDDRVVRGEKLPDDDQQADMYLWTVERLAAAGYRQYEISNFARAGFQSRHNLKYWMGRPYIGFGPGGPLRLRRAALLFYPGSGGLYCRRAGGGHRHRRVRPDPPAGAGRRIFDAPPAHHPGHRGVGVPPGVLHELRSHRAEAGGVRAPGLGGAARPPLESDGQGLPGVQPAHWGAAVHSGGGDTGKDSAPAEAGQAGGGVRAGF